MRAARLEQEAATERTDQESRARIALQEQESDGRMKLERERLESEKWHQNLRTYRGFAISAGVTTGMVGIAYRNSNAAARASDAAVRYYDAAREAGEFTLSLTENAPAVTNSSNGGQALGQLVNFGVQALSAWQDSRAQPGPADVKLRRAFETCPKRCYHQLIDSESSAT